MVGFMIGTIIFQVGVVLYEIATNKRLAKIEKQLQLIAERP